MIPLLLRPKLSALRNSLRRSYTSPARVIRDGVLIFFSFSLMMAIFHGTRRLLTYLHKDLAFAYLSPTLLLGLMLFFLFGMLIFSGIASAFGALFMARDLDLILSAPVSRFRFFLGKLSEVLWSSSWMVIVFGIPALLAVGSAYGADWHFYAACVVALAPYFVISSTAALLIALFFVRFTSTRRTKELLKISSVLLLLLLYLLVTSLRPASALSSVNELVRVIALLSLPNTTWMPSYWSASMLGGILQPQLADPHATLILLYSVAVGLTALAYLAMSLLHFDAYSRSRGIRVATRRNSAKSQSRWLSLAKPLPQAMRAIFIKEAKCFSRELSYALQLLVLLSIAIIYLYNLREAPKPESFPIGVRTWWQGFFMAINISMGAFIITAACTRFVFPSISLEGQSYWTLQIAPISAAELLRAKRLCWFIPTAFLATIIFSAGAFALRVGPEVVILNMLTGVIISYGIVGLAVGLGAVFSNLDWEHPSELAASFGSLVFMLVSTLLITLNAIPSTYLIVLRTRVDAASSFNLTQWYFAAIADIALLYYLNAKISGWILRTGERALEKKFA